MAFQTPKTDWTGADGVRFGDMNRIEGNILHLNEHKAELSAFNALSSNVDNILYDISNRVLLQDLPLGAEFGLYEDGVLVPFIKLAANYESSGRILVVRKDCYTMETLKDTHETTYNGCYTDTWLNNTYISSLNTAVQSVLAAVSIKTATAISTTTISRKAFLLSATELGLSVTDGVPVEGTAVAYFNSNSRRVSRFRGSTTNYWTRSINTSTSNAGYVSAGGTFAVAIASSPSLGIRPAFTLPGTLEVTAGVPSASNVMATAEVI